MDVLIRVKCPRAVGNLEPYAGRIMRAVVTSDSVKLQPNDSGGEWAPGEFEQMLALSTPGFEYTVKDGFYVFPPEWWVAYMCGSFDIKGTIDKADINGKKKYKRIAIQMTDSAIASRHIARSVGIDPTMGRSCEYYGDEDENNAVE